jgi:hypothetical protein
MLTQVLMLAWHHDALSSEGTEPAPTEQQGMGVLKVVLPWADARPAKAEAATTRDE